MPLARWAVYQGGPQIWVAPTADDSDGWLATMRHIAIESGAFVVSVPQYIPAAAFPADFPVPLPEGKEVFGRGGAAIVDPSLGRGHRRPAVRRGGHRRRRLRPAPGAPREALVRRRRPLCPYGRSRRAHRHPALRAGGAAHGLDPGRVGCGSGLPLVLHSWRAIGSKTVGTRGGGFECCGPGCGRFCS